MLRLFKYEIQRKGKAMLLTLVGYLLINVVFLLKFKGDGTFSIEDMPFQVVLFIILASGLWIVSLIGAVNNLRLEAKLPTRDLYFSLPLTAYTKIGSKVILSTVEMVGAGLIAAITCMKSIEYLTHFNVLKLFINELAKTETSILILGMLSIFFSIIASLLVVYLSFAIFRAFFSQAKFGGAITVGIYLALNYIISKFAFKGVKFGFNEGVLSSGDYFSENVLPLLLTMALASILFLLTSILFEKRVSFD